MSVWLFGQRRTLPPITDPGDVLLRTMRELQAALANFGSLLVQTRTDLEHTRRELSQVRHDLAEARVAILTQEHRTHKLERRLDDLAAE